MNVSLFVTCLVDQLYPDIGVAMVRLLRRYGCKVDFPARQVCCGQPAFNSGYTAEARAVAANQIAAFAQSEYVVTPSGSCAGMVRHYYHELFAGDPHHLEQAERFVAKTYEFTEFLVDILGVTDVGAACPHPVTFHPSCHGSRILGVKEPPLILLRNVRGIDLIPLPKAQDCCGFGGTFAVKLSDISGSMVDEKVGHIVETGAEYLVSTDMGCIMNIAGRMKKRGLDIQPLHIAEFLHRFSSGAPNSDSDGSVNLR